MKVFVAFIFIHYISISVITEFEVVMENMIVNICLTEIPSIVRVARNVLKKERIILIKS